MTSRLAVIAVDSHDPRALADFWCAVLGWQVVDEDESGIGIGPADGRGPGIDLLAVPDRKTVKNRLHLDLRADGTSTAEELDRLLALGARRVDVGQGADVSWVVLADPEGNEFCLLSRTVQDVERERAAWSGGSGPAVVPTSSAAPPGWLSGLSQPGGRSPGAGPGAALPGC